VAGRPRGCAAGYRSIVVTRPGCQRDDGEEDDDTRRERSRAGGRERSRRRLVWRSAHLDG